MVSFSLAEQLVCQHGVCQPIIFFHPLFRHFILIVEGVEPQVHYPRYRVGIGDREKFDDRGSSHTSACRITTSLLGKV